MTIQINDKRKLEKEYHRIRLRELRKGNLLILDRLKFVKIAGIDPILQIVSAHTHLPVGKIKMKTRDWDVLIPRQLAQHFCVKYLNRPFSKYSKNHITLKKIGQEIGGKSHAAAYHSFHEINKLYDTNYMLLNGGSFRNLYNNIDDEIQKTFDITNHDDTGFACIVRER